MYINKKKRMNILLPNLKKNFNHKDTSIPRIKTLHVNVVTTLTFTEVKKNYEPGYSKVGW